MKKLKGRTVYSVHYNFSASSPLETISPEHLIMVPCHTINISFSRTATRRTGAAVSYKEASDEQTDSSDLLEVEGVEGEAEGEPEPEDHSETIERVLGHRRGKKGGTQLHFYSFICFELKTLPVFFTIS